MLLADKLYYERRMSRYETIVSQIRDALGELTIDQMAKYFKVKRTDCDAAVGFITAHPDWDDEKVAEEVDWED